MDDVILIKDKKIFEDNRGKFLEIYSKKTYEKYGISKNFVVDCLSINKKNVIRGMHYQFDKPLDKLISVIHGSILDVVIDIRSSSKNFGKVYTYLLSSENKNQLLVPAGFAHGFMSLENNTCVIYKFNDYYNPLGEGAINPFDKFLNIPWNIHEKDVICSEKDILSQTFLDYKKNPKF